MERLKKYIRVCLALTVTLLMAVAVLEDSTETMAAKKAAVIKNSNITVFAGETAAIELDNSVSGATYKYSSNKKAVAMVNKNGIVTGRKSGKAQITVKQVYQKKTTKIGTVTVTVKKLALKGTYTINVNSYATGAYADKAIVKFDRVVDSIQASDLAVSESKMEVDFVTNKTAESTADRMIESAYLCDATGRKANGASKYIAIELKPTADCKGIFGISSLMSMNVWKSTYKLNIALASGASVTSGGRTLEKISIEPEYTYMSLSDDVERFNTANAFKASDGVEYKYATYTPVQESHTLVVWLHGLGEGGKDDTDPRVALLGAEATALAKNEFQGKVGGAHILAPQCPTWWMDPTGKGEVIDSTTTESFYTNSLDELIDSYAAKIGAEKIVIAGCSNGGYMTMVLALKNPTKYDAIIPICEALEYSESLNARLDALKDLPMYFVYSEDDPLVVPSLHEIPTIEYLKKIGAVNLHVSVTEHVVATYEGMEPSMQFGHASWIYFFNNETNDGSGLSAWDWLAGVLE